jgi:hypothetical protein
MLHSLQPVYLFAAWSIWILSLAHDAAELSGVIQATFDMVWRPLDLAVL